MRSTAWAVILAGLLCGSAWGIGKTDPVRVSFSNGQELNLSLSDTDINQLQVEGDKINHIACPSGACSINSYPDDAAGSAYVAISTNAPFTLYVTTEAGRSFAVQVNPVASPGVTYYFSPQSGGLSASAWESNTDYQQVLEDVLGAVLAGKTPDDYGYSDCSIKGSCIDMTAQTLYSVLKLTPVAEYTGDALKEQVYRMTNTSKTTLDLFESTLAEGNSAIRAIALGAQSLTAGASGMLYEVVGEQNED